MPQPLIMEVLPSLNKKGQWFWRLKGANGEILGNSETIHKKAHVLRIAKKIINSQIDLVIKER